MDKPNIEPTKFTDADSASVRKSVTTLYFVGDDIFQAVEKIKQEKIDASDKDVLTKGVYKVAIKGKIDEDVVNYINGEVKKLSEGTQSKEDSDGQKDDSSEVVDQNIPQPESYNTNDEGNSIEKKEKDIEEIKKILGSAKTYAANTNNKDDSGKIRVDDEIDMDIEDIIPLLNAALDNNKNLEISELLDKAIDAVDINDAAAKNILDDDDSDDLNINKALAFVKNEIAKLQPTSSDDEKTSPKEADTAITTEDVKTILTAAKDVETILTAAKDNIEEKEGSDKKYKIKDTPDYTNSKEADLKPVLVALEIKLKTEVDLNLEKLLTDAIAKVTGDQYKLPSDEKSASDVAVGLINGETDDSDNESENKTDIVETVKTLLNKAKTYVADEKNKDENDKIKASDDTELQKVIEAIQTKIESESNIVIDILLQNAIDAIPTKLDSDTSAADVAVGLIGKSNDDIGNLDEDEIEKSAVTVETVTELLKKVKAHATTKANQSDKQITEIDNDTDSNVVIAAVNEKIKNNDDIHLDTELGILFDNAIYETKKDGYTLPDDKTKTASEIAAELITASSFDLSYINNSGGKPNKYVYGGKTVRAYPKNISFSKKNPSKKRHNKKTIRKLQKLMNKRK